MEKVNHLFRHHALMKVGPVKGGPELTRYHALEILT
jgi:hypothetical protein